MSYGVNGPTGFTPVGTQTGASWTEKTVQYTINQATSGDDSHGTMYLQDLVTAAATGYILQSTSGADAPAQLGVFMGCQFTVPSAASSSAPFTPSKAWIGGTPIATGTTVTAFVSVDENTLYDVQVDSSVVAGYPFANLFTTANMLISTAYGTTVAAGGGNPVTSLSSMTIGASATTATNNVKVFGLASGSIGSSTNRWGIPFNNMLVKLNTSVYALNTQGI